MTPWSLMSLACAPADLSADPERIANGDELGRPATELRRWHLDADRDGFGDPASSLLARTRPRGHVASGRDCLDAGDDAAATYPGAAYFEVGNDCETDADGDGFGSMAPASGVTAGLDCDDGDASTWCGDERSVGNDVEFATASNHSPDYLLGSAVELRHPIVLTALALIGKSATANVKMALYTDSEGEPGTLIAATESNPVPVGVLEIPIEPRRLAAGTYWIMAVYDANASVGLQISFVDPTKFRVLSFEDPIPRRFGETRTQTVSILNYYLVGY